MVGNHRYEIRRKRTSYNFKADMAAPDSWDGDHNAKHNMEDVVILFDGESEVYRFPAQTVANMPDARHTDTLMPGKGFIKWNVARRAFKGHIHGFVGFVDQDGQTVDENSVELIPSKDGSPADWARWIFGHSTRRNDPAPEGKLTRYAWSAGCTITDPEHQDEHYQVGVDAGFKDGDHIPCEIIEVEGE